MWTAELRIDYFENARGKFIKTDYETADFEDLDDLDNLIRSYELAADVDNDNADVKILAIKEK